MYEAGAWVLLESAIADLPADLRWLFESGAVTLEQLARCTSSSASPSLADLAAAVDEQAIRSVPGLDETVEARGGRGAADAARDDSAHSARAGRRPRRSDPRALRVAPGVEWALPAGSLRRGQDTVGDIEIVAAAADPRRRSTRSPACRTSIACCTGAHGACIC